MENLPVERKIVLAIADMRKLLEEMNLDTKVPEQYERKVRKVLAMLSGIRLGDFLE